MSIPEVSKAYPEFKSALDMAFHAVRGLIAEFGNEISDWDAEAKAVTRGHTYWIDHKGQPRRIKHRKPLLHKGRKP